MTQIARDDARRMGRACALLESAGWRRVPVDGPFPFFVREVDGQITLSARVQRLRVYVRRHRSESEMVASLRDANELQTLVGMR